jgi:uncharacterized membrane protein
VSEGTQKPSGDTPDADLVPLGIAVPLDSGKKGSKPDMQGMMVVQAAQFSGPLPPPALLEHYDAIHPGAADRIIRMAEEQGAHRREMEKLTVKADILGQRWGLVLGFVLAMTIVIGGIWLISKGMAVSGLVAIIGAIAGPVGVFVYGKHQQRKELELESQKPESQKSAGKKPKNQRRK